jgi:hypothetical protein
MTTEPLRVAAEAQQAAVVAEPRQLATAVEAQQAASVTAATTTAVVVEIPDDDVPPPGWDQWASLPTSAPEAPTGALVVRSDVGEALGRPADGAGASSSRAGPTACPEQGREHADAPLAHFIDAQAEQGLWQELRDHGASLNRALNEALRIHSGPAWRVFQVSRVSQSLLPLYFACVFLLTPTLLALLVGDRSWSVGPGRGTTPSTASTPTFTGTGSRTRPWTPSSRP